MTRRKQLITVSVIIALIVFPVLIVQAQSQGETEALPATEGVAETAEPAAAAANEPNASDAEPAQPAEQEGSVLGAETSTETDPPATTSESASADEEGAAAALSDETASTTASEFIALDTASSTASSTEPLPDAPVEHFTVPEDEPFVLQPAVSFSVSGNTATADVVLENLTCKACDKVMPELEVLAYYTEAGDLQHGSGVAVHL
jgi:hypothetical protein